MQVTKRLGLLPTSEGVREHAWKGRMMLVLAGFVKVVFPATQTAYPEARIWQLLPAILITIIAAVILALFVRRFLPVAPLTAPEGGARVGIVLDRAPFNWQLELSLFFCFSLGAAAWLGWQWIPLFAPTLAASWLLHLIIPVKGKVFFGRSDLEELSRISSEEEFYQAANRQHGLTRRQARQVAVGMREESAAP